MTSFEKPTKATRINEIRKRERKKKDRETQQAVPQGFCYNCRKLHPTCGHHLKSRRFNDTRHDEGNLFPVCFECHNAIHSLSAGVLIQRFPLSPLLPVWQETIEQKRNKPYTSGFPVKP